MGPPPERATSAHSSPAPLSYSSSSTPSPPAAAISLSSCARYRASKRHHTTTTTTSSVLLSNAMAHFRDGALRGTRLMNIGFDMRDGRTVAVHGSLTQCIPGERVERYCAYVQHHACATDASCWVLFATRRKILF